MFDVPPPEQGVRGIDVYRETWPDFFAWRASGAVFEIESLEVTAGADVAFAGACCGAARQRISIATLSDRLRLTIGMAKTGHWWTVTDEHHSFTDVTGRRIWLPPRSGRCTSNGSTAPRRRTSTG